MTLTQLECLCALGRELDFDRAAEACGLSTDYFQAVLRTIGQTFDAEILLPGARFAGFTPQGERILDWAARSLVDCDRLRQEVRTLQAENAVAPLIERRSISPKRLGGPGPGREDIDRMLRAALRAPDHGGLRPWRVLAFEQAEREALAALFRQEKLRRDPLAPADDLRRAGEHATRSPVLLAFVVSPKPRSKVPVREQWLAAGAALSNFLNAAHRLGYGAIMLSGERCFDIELARQLGVDADEFLAGFISLGQVVQQPPGASVVPTDEIYDRWTPETQVSAPAGAVR